MSGNRNDVLQHIENPLDNDVLGGRGGASYKHKGNIAYRRLVQLSKVSALKLPTKAISFMGSVV